MPVHRRRLSDYGALQKLVTRLMRSDVADANRLRYTAAALVKAREDAAQRLATLDQLTRSFAENLEHARPILLHLAALPDDPDQPEVTPSQLIYRRLRDVVMRRLPADVLHLALGQPCHCPVCGRPTPETPDCSPVPRTTPVSS